MAKNDTLTALIIDDEIDICFLLGNILRYNNLKVKFVHTVKDGKTALEQIKPELLFLDNHLEDGYGIEFIAFIKTQYPATKIIMVTAHDTPEDRKKALSEGADVFIAKPFSATEIKAAIDKVYLPG